MHSLSMFQVMCACPKPLIVTIQPVWRESQEDFVCSCGSRYHYFCDSEAGHPLQFVQFSLACFAFNSRPPHCGSIGCYGSYSHSIYPVYYLWLQSPYFSKCASAQPESLVGFVDHIIQLFFSMSVPCLMLVQDIWLQWLLGLFT
jgi:hypothetical protein